jgi:hypothetical protein
MTGSDLAALRVLVHLIEEKLCAVWILRKTIFGLKK